jgi:PAS domain S-box-containing protein
VETYLAATIFVAAATLARLAADRIVVGAQFANPYFLAVIGSTLCGGMCVGFFSVMVSMLAAWYFFLVPYYSGFAGGEVYSLVAFAVVASPMVYMVSLLQSAGAVIDRAHMRAAVAEEHARSADELRRWKDIFDSIAIGISVFEPVDDTIIFVNQAFASLYGMSEDQCAGASIYDLSPPSERTRLTTLIKTCDDVGSVNGEATNRKKDGSTFPVRFHGTTVRSTTGGVLYRICSTIDITAERELQNRWTDVVESADFGMGIIEPGTNTVLSCNNAYAAAHSMAVSEMLGSSVLDLYLPAERERVASLLAASDANGHVDYEADRIRKDGSGFPARIHVTSVREPEDGLRYRISTVHDISHERHLQAQLRQAQRLEAIGQLSAGVAHDFNNLLQGIIAHLELVDDDIVAAATREKVGTAIRLAEQGGSLSQRLLSFARKQLLMPQNIDLHDFLEDFCRLLSRTLDPRIRVELRIASDLKTIWADPTHLRSALLNVAINARDAMPSGGLLTIEGGYTGPSQDMVLFRITDTGSGIAPDDLHRVCEPFFSTKGLNGTGLGLSMVHGFVNQSGGDLRIVSTLGKGTAVELSLPAQSAAATTAAA